MNVIFDTTQREYYGAHLAHSVLSYRSCYLYVLRTQQREPVLGRPHRVNKQLRVRMPCCEKANAHLIVLVS